MEYNTELNIAIEALRTQKAIEKGQDGDVLTVKGGKLEPEKLDNIKLLGETMAEWLTAIETRITALEEAAKAAAETSDENTKKIVEAIETLAGEINSDKLILK